MTHYYNENDPKAAAWLRELIRAGLIPAGDVDERSIRDVEAADLARYAQAHFFAGIGGWPLALSLAGWPVDRPVWTGSCPCPPFSSAAKKFCKCGRRFGFYGVDRFGCESCGTNDERHLWPEFRRILADGRPPVCVGEQVASADGREWLTRVRADLEALGYAVGAADLCAAGTGAPHIRQRLFWVADADGRGLRQGRRTDAAGESRSTGNGEAGRLADATGASGPEHEHDARERARGGAGHTAVGDAARRLVLPVGARLEGHAGDGDDGREPGRVGAVAGGSTAAAGAARGVADGNGQRFSIGAQQNVGADEPGQQPSRRADAGGRRDTFWSAFDLIPCRDGKARRVEPSIFPLAHGVSGRVGLLRGAGNAIVPALAAEFVTAWREAREAVPA